MRQFVMGLVTLLPMIAMACAQGQTTAEPTSQTMISSTEEAIIGLPLSPEPSSTAGVAFLATSTPVLTPSGAFAVVGIVGLATSVLMTVAFHRVRQLE